MGAKRTTMFHLNADEKVKEHQGTAMTATLYHARCKRGTKHTGAERVAALHLNADKRVRAPGCGCGDQPSSSQGC